MNKGKISRFLFVDDDKNYHKTLQRIARELGASLDCVCTGEEGKSKLDNNSKVYSGVILDFNCIKKEGEKPTVKFLNWFLTYINGIDRFLPRVVLSGNPKAEEQKEVHEIKIYRKNGEEEACIKRLIKMADKTSIERLKGEYSNIFEIFEKSYLDDSSQKYLIDCIECAEDTSSRIIRKELTTYRLIIANTFSAINKSRKGFINEESLFNLKKDVNKLEIANIIDQLKNNKAIHHEAIAYRALKYINAITRSEGHHNNNEKNQQAQPDFYGPEPTQFTLRTVLNAMMDYLLWFKNWMEENSTHN